MAEAATDAEDAWQGRLASPTQTRLISLVQLITAQAWQAQPNLAHPGIPGSWGHGDPGITGSLKPRSPGSQDPGILGIPGFWNTGIPGSRDP